jgi:hypothetical protein
MPADRQQARAYVLLGLVMLLWAGNSIVGRAVRDDVGPVHPVIRALGRREPGPAAVRARPDAARLGRAEGELGDRRRARLTGVAAFNALMYSGPAPHHRDQRAAAPGGDPPAVIAADRLLFGVRRRGGCNCSASSLRCSGSP